VTVHDADAADRAGRDARETLLIEGVGRQERAIAVGDLVGARIEDVESVELEPPAVCPAIAESRIARSGRGAGKIAVLCERAAAGIAIFEAPEPARGVSRLQPRPMLSRVTANNGRSPGSRVVA
jgi:hypothetical protein